MAGYALFGSAPGGGGGFGGAPGGGGGFGGAPGGAAGGGFGGAAAAGGQQVVSVPTAAIAIIIGKVCAQQRKRARQRQRGRERDRDIVEEETRYRDGATKPTEIEAKKQPVTAIEDAQRNDAEERKVTARRDTRRRTSATKIREAMPELFRTERGKRRATRPEKATGKMDGAPFSGLSFFLLPPLPAAPPVTTPSFLILSRVARALTSSSRNTMWRSRHRAVRSNKAPSRLSASCPDLAKVRALFADLCHQKRKKRKPHSQTSFDKPLAICE